MSIYASTFGIGDEPGDAPGTVLEYQAGHIYPRPATHTAVGMDGAHIPAWCVPGHADADSNDECDAIGPWYRLGFRDGDDFLLDEAAAVALRDDLTAFIDRDKVH